MKAPRWKLVLVLALPVFSVGTARAAEPLVPLASPGPWSGVSGLIGYGGRVWFVNSVKFVDHNSADVYSYDPASGATRYEHHLFSQDAGKPAVAGGLLYWPFEDSRFSVGRGEYMVTNGRDWQWGILPDGEVFHAHAMFAHEDALYAATSAWRAGLQRSEDGISWRVIYDHPTPSGSVTRITTLASLGDTLYAGLTDKNSRGSKLLRWAAGTFRPVAVWPAGTAVTALAAYGGWLYGVNEGPEGRALWRTDGTNAQRVTALDGHRIRELAAGVDAVWAVGANKKGGALLRSPDGMTWTVEQTFESATPLDLLIHDGKAYVGTEGPNGRGTLWGQPAPSPGKTEPPAPPLRSATHHLSEDRLRTELQSLDRLLAARSGYADHGRRLRDALEPLARTRMSQAGAALAERLKGPFPNIKIAMFGGQLTVSAGTLARWHLLRAIALNGHGRIPPEPLVTPFGEKPNRAEKYLNPGSVTAWAVAQLGQRDPATIAALIEALSRKGQPLWLDGDYIGALTVLTDQRFGYDAAAWRAWWARQRSSLPPREIRIPAGALLMGANDGEPADRPVHRVVLNAFSIDRFETTNKEFAEFVSATGHVTDAETQDEGWHWEGEWRPVKKADWRHSHGPESSIEGLENHPVVQVSWNDAQAYCRWRGKRLPTEAEWERAARGEGRRTYPWGNQPPHEGKRYRASYGNDRCCRADAGDGHLFTAPVGSFPLGRSPFGVEDMAGNVWEWVEDWFDPDFYHRSPAENPVNRTPGERKVIRGGGWGNDPRGLRSTLRHANPAGIGLSMVGFRCARNTP